MGARGIFPARGAIPDFGIFLARCDRKQLGALIELAIELADMLDGDPDAEIGSWPDDVRAVDRLALPEDAEAIGDEQDAAWHEWTSMDRAHRRRTYCQADLNGHEDDEDDDEREDDDPAGQSDEDGINTGSAEGVYHSWERGPGCPISDPNEEWQDTANVPMIDAFTLDYNVFNDQRVSLGIVNLQSSFRVAEPGVRSADSGKMHWNRATIGLPAPGVPV